MSGYPFSAQPQNGILPSPYSGSHPHPLATPQPYQPFAETSSAGATGYTDYADTEPSSGKAKKASNAVAKEKGPPVKAACLSCRGKKAKCDGLRPQCTTCIKRGFECEYVKSRRGGARKKRPAPVPSALQQYLVQLDSILGLPDYKVAKSTRAPTDDVTNIVREFTSREEIFRNYYTDVHPFVPVMPQQEYMDQVLPTLLKDSPFILAAQTILTLVPHPDDPEPRSANSKRLRNATSQALAQKCTNLINQMVERGERSLECVQALTMLALWEWSANGSVHANRERSSHATQIAMEMSLHDMDKYATEPDNRALEGVDWRKDMARRTWWQIYVNQLSSAVVTGNSPILSPDDERVHVFYPVCSVDDQSWPRWIEVNKQCTRVFNIVNTVYFSHLTGDAGGNAWGKTNTAASVDVKEQMRKQIFEVDAQVTEMMKEAEKMSVIELVPGGEEEVVRNQQLSGRLGLAVIHIHIHRQQAFPEVSLFSKRICGLPAAVKDLETPVTSGQVSPAQTGMASTLSPVLTDPTADGPFEFLDELWQPNQFPESLNDPWFALDNGAGSLYKSYNEEPVFQDGLTAEITSYHSPSTASEKSAQARPTLTEADSADSTIKKPRKAWGVDENDQVEEPPVGIPIDPDARELFPPGMSLARCASAAHTVVRLEVLHRSAAIALWKGPPKWMPFCACGLVTGAYAFLLLALATQAESMYRPTTQKAVEQVEGLLTNVEIIVAGLEAYGQMWAGIEVMAAEVRAALEAAKSLPGEIRRQIDETAYQANLVPAPLAQQQITQAPPAPTMTPPNGYPHDGQVQVIPAPNGYTRDGQGQVTPPIPIAYHIPETHGIVPHVSGGYVVEDPHQFSSVSPMISPNGYPAHVPVMQGHVPQAHVPQYMTPEAQAHAQAQAQAHYYAQTQGHPQAVPMPQPQGSWH